MLHEIETKILEVGKAELSRVLDTLGAKKIAEARLKVSWFRTKNSNEGDDKWYLRVRTYSNEKSEVTWKGESDVLGASRKHKEISFETAEPDKMMDLFAELGLEKYAYQEKDRISWIYKDWRFDLDQYPGMPSYLEIEGSSENHIQEAIEILDLKNHEISSEGERTLIQNKYDLDWYNMKFFGNKKRSTR